MCLILFGFKTHPDYKLILAGNRDEFYNRPTSHAGFWEEDPLFWREKIFREEGHGSGLHAPGVLLQSPIIVILNPLKKMLLQGVLSSADF
jgi:hypothetical protein